MHSPRTDGDRSTASRWARFNPQSPAALFQRLNVRLVFALAVVALVSLIVSGVAILQILPGYFIQQTEERLETAAAAVATDLGQSLDDAAARNVTVLSPEVRNTQVIQPAAARGARIHNATVTILNDAGQQVAYATPLDSRALESQGLSRDSDVRPADAEKGVQFLGGPRITYTVYVSEPYTNRAETLQQIQSALVGAGLLALIASLITGVMAARSITAPIGRLRRVAARIGQGSLDERAVPSGVLEVDELGQQFNVMADRLSGTLRMLEADRDRLREFVADVSHELRTPIAALRMYTELLEDETLDDATRRELLERSVEQIGRLEWLSTNLLDLSRIDAGIYPLDIREGDIRDPIQTVVQALSEVALERGVALDSVVPGHAVELRFDRERMVQLLTNLVGNALKFTPRDGAVSVELAEADDAVTIEVRDTGPGITAEELPHIFDRFYRGTNTGEARASGSGLGLAIVRSIVEMHGGEIDVASALGEGTQFRITLPRDDAVATDTAEDKVNETSRSTQPARNPGPIG